MVEKYNIETNDRDNIKLAILDFLKWYSSEWMNEWIDWEKSFCLYLKIMEAK